MLCLVFGSLLFGSRVKKEDYHLSLIEYDYIPLGRVCIKRVSPFGEEYTNHFGSEPNSSQQFCLGLVTIIC